MCNYYASVFNTEQCNDELTYEYVGRHTNDMLPVNIEIDTIISKLEKLNIYKSAGPDMLHPRVLKELRHEIAQPLKLIFETSLKTEYLPLDWRSGNITPIYKKGKRCYVENYRPVSLTCITCKILESILRDSIVKFFFNNNTFSNRQYGFIKGRSTVTQLLKILDTWTIELENGGQVDVIYTDLEKAFDKVPHKLLINKIRALSVNPNIANWIESFLNNRRQRVRINDSFSNWDKVISGIPQGSILGPLLFIIYINDLVGACNSGSNIYLYADDAKLFKYISRTEDTHILQSDIDKLNDWIEKWLLKLNIAKCKIVSFGRNIDVDGHYNIRGVEIDRVNSIKDLGVTFDTKLKFDDHIQEKINKATSILGIIKRNFRNISEFAFVTLYKSLVRSHLEYANTVWSPYRKEDIIKLEKVQMRATKLIHGLKHLSYNERLKRLKLPTLKFRRARGDMIEVYKIITGKYDVETTVSFIPNSDTITRGNRFKLYQGQVKYDLRKYFFSNRIIRIWNSLPDSIVNAVTTNTFKNRLDKFWCSQSMFYNFDTEMTGIGGRSYNMLLE